MKGNLGEGRKRGKRGESKPYRTSFHMGQLGKLDILQMYFMILILSE